MNNNAVLPFCQFPTQRPLAYKWFTEYVQACNMQLEFLVLYQILSEVEALDDSGKWGYNQDCYLSIQDFSDKWNMSPTTVRNAIKCLELSGIITVQHSRGRSSHIITLTPHTTWVVTDFRELREITKVKRSPIPSPVTHVTDTVTPSPDTVTPSRSPIPSPILKPKLDTATDTNGYRHNAYANNIPSSVIGSPCPEDIKAKYCRRSPVAHTVTDTVTPITLPVMDINGNVTNTVTLSVSKSKSKSKRSYSPSPGQYEDSDNDDLPIFGMSYPEYRASPLWDRK